MPVYYFLNIESAFYTIETNLIKDLNYFFIEKFLEHNYIKNRKMFNLTLKHEMASTTK